MKRNIRALCAGSLILFALIVVNIVAAHEQRTIGNGKYDVEVGWLNEPTVANQANAATIEIHKAGTQDAILGVEKTLKVDIAAGGKDEGVFALRTVDGKPGLYAADYTPPVTGSYVFTFTGTIESTTINETFESGPGRFDDAVTAEQAARETPAPDEDRAATEAIVAPAPTTAASAPTPAAPNNDATVAIVIVGVIVVLVAGGLMVIRRRS